MEERMHVDLKGKVVLITGAGGVIGRAMAIEFAKNDAVVVANDISEKSLLATKEEINKLGRDCIIKAADLCDQAAVNKMVEEIVAECGSLDVLCNNAGINGGPDDRKNFWEYRDTLFDKIMELDLYSLYYVSKPVITQMLKQGSGSIINTASIVGLVPLRLQIGFTAAKGAVVNMTKAMAVELGDKGVRVNAIAPGSVITQQLVDLFYSDEKKKKQLVSHFPMQRPGEPCEIASMACYLASDDASYVTGQIIAVDGGWVTGYCQ